MVHAGQLASCILQGALRGAVRVGAPKGRLKAPTPMNDPVYRRVTRDRHARKILSRWQRRWRFEQQVAELTSQRTSMAKHSGQKPENVLQGSGRTARWVRVRES